MKKPLIGITCNYDYRDTVGMASDMGIAGQDWNFVSGDYIYILEKAGAIPVMLPIYKEEDVTKFAPLLDTLDGFLITGGHDVGPERYGFVAKGCCGTIMPPRDRQDIALAKYFMYEKKKPLLGICRGIQVLNVALGGTLYQDLEKEGGFEHHFGAIYPRNTAWHTVRLTPGSMLAKIFGKEEIPVNSYHHQAVREPGGAAVVTAVSPDGVSEAIEVPGHPFAIGVQWHPEMMFDSDEQLKLIQAFVESCK